MTQRPNILIFMTDHQRGDSVLGKAIMPNSERLREQGVTFSETFCPSPHCCPARATFFTGQYPSQHNIWHNVVVGNAISRELADGTRTWSEDLSDAGYRMWYSGKWHVSMTESPADRGWNCCEGTKSDYSNNKPANVWPRYESEGAGWVDRDRGPDQIMNPGYPPFTICGTSNPTGKSGDEKVVREAAEKLKELATEPSDQPWCLYAGCIGPHDPYFVPQEYLDMYDIDDIELPPNFHDDMMDKPNFYRRTKDIFSHLSDDEHRKAILHFLAYCTYEDALLGKLLDALEETGQVDNTVVVATSDHGDYMGEHGLWAKGVPCFRGAYHVPMIIRWPNGISNPGSTVDEMVSLADFAPTMLDVAGVEADRGFVGESLVPFFKSESPEWRDMLFTQTNGNELYAIQRACFDKQFKMVYNGFDYDELYDLQNDPHELKNLADDPDYKPVVRRLMKRIWQFAHETGDTCINPYIMVRFAQFGPGIAFEE